MTVELDCEEYPSDLYGIDPACSRFTAKGTFHSGDIIRQGADGRGGRATALSHNNSINLPQRVSQFL